MIRHVDDEQQTGYRKKVCLHASFNGRCWEFGMISRRQFIATPACPVQHESINKVIEILSESLPPADMFPLHYFIQSGKQVLLVLKTAVLPDHSWLGEHLVNRLKRAGVEGFWIHLNPSAGNKIFMKHNFFLLFGNNYSTDEYGMQYGPMSFQQLIPELFFQSLEEAGAFFNPDPGHLVIDLYCGTGYSMKTWMISGAATVGVELNGEAVECCRNNIPGALIYRGKCSDRIPQLNDFAREHADKKRLLYVNPPRTGIEKEVLQWIYTAYRPERMAYLSCSAGTLARDLDVLCNEVFVVKRIIPFDFFPRTIHVECLALLAFQAS